MKIFLLFLFVLMAACSISQPFNNEWIDYNKTYYKFQVGSSGWYHIDQSLLASVELNAVLAQQWQLWRNGKQVPLYASIKTGVFSINDYIEFHGEQNDGKADKELYRDPAFQLSDKISLQTDTAAYFLTVDPIVSHNLRFTDRVNDISSNTILPEPYFICSLRYDFKDRINKGYAVNMGEDIYSSAYDKGEFFSTRDITLPANNYVVSGSHLFASSSGPALIISASLAGNAAKSRRVQLRLNHSVVLDRTINNYDAAVYADKTIPLSLLNTDVADFDIGIITNDSFDRVVSGFIEMQYPRRFNFAGASSFSFSLPASAKGNYLEIDNFNRSSGYAAMLYDQTHLGKYSADTMVLGLLRFVLPPSTEATDFILVSEQPDVVKNINNLQSRNFINFSATSAQGNYLIISNRLLYSGVNAVGQFRQYRSSMAGGNFNAKVYDIDELTDQFAFGIKKHPSAIRNFIRYANQVFTQKPVDILLIGKAVTYDSYRMNESSPYADRLNLVPTFGSPASDVLLVSNGIDPIASVPVGRIAAVNSVEVSDYLEKVKQFEQQQASGLRTIANKAWMKQVVHVEGANDANLDALLTGYLDNYKRIVQDTLVGALVTGFTKLSTGAATPVVNAEMNNLFSSGISLLTYFGHSATTTLDYNLDDPGAYHNIGKYPLFLVNGCSAGNFYDYDTSRLGIITSLAERYVLAPQKGAIGFIADSHFGLTSYLDLFSTGFYKSLASRGYNQGIGRNLTDAAVYLNLADPFSDFLSRVHAEEIVLHGDPAIKMYTDAKPDFVIEDPQVIINPSFISVADKQFTLKAYLYNTGKATGDSVNVLVKRQYPDGTTAILLNKKIKSIRYIDSISLTIPVVSLRDKGNNTLTITVDNNNEYEEMSKSNNSITKTFVIYEDELNPVYPYDLSIVNKNTVLLQASTANPLSGIKQYRMEMDTTGLFTSTFKIVKVITTSGGLVQFDPGIILTDSMVYYWRVAPVITSGEIHWHTASFIYIAGGGEGFNQSHFYQHLQSVTNRIYLDSPSRKWMYQPAFTNITIRQGVFPFTNEDNQFATLINGTIYAQSACLGHSIILNLYDPVTMRPLYNQPFPATAPNGVLGSFMGSAAYCGKAGRQYNFEFSMMDTMNRKLLANFMDWIPVNYIVTARMNLDAPYDQNPFAATWKNDAAVYGANNTLYSHLKSVGFTAIDSFSFPRTWVLIYQKNTVSFTPKWAFSKGLNDAVALSVNVASPDSLGTITSPIVGPAKAWKQLKWRGSSMEKTAGDVVTVNVVGMDSSHTATFLFSLPLAQQDVDLSQVNAVKYPYLQLLMKNQDSVTLTPYQLSYWRVLYDPVPEGCLAANIKYSGADTVEVGDSLRMAVAFKNVSTAYFSDSLEVKMQVTDKNNTVNAITVNKLKKLLSGDTAIVSAVIDTRKFVGNNTLYMEVNPGNTQPEQYHFNNFLYKEFYVRGDNKKPLLEVTFDGIHILNGDIVSSKPNIRITLQDESKYMALDDTSLVTVQLQYPDNSIHRYSFGTDTLHFTPASLAAGNNSAIIDFKPSLWSDGKYQLMVDGKDKSGNAAGTQQYLTLFDVYNKAMISNVFNYPNPFTTSTAFVFTLSGSQVPQNIRIEVMTVTGKIVKEITKEYLGMLHIGRNITSYKWDGTDQFGQKLANGVYLYRVITNLNGNSLDKFTFSDTNGDEVNTDQYFKGGYGKMYLMR